MDKRIAIHQPMFLPYLGFFDKVRQVDQFVVLDDAQFSKGDFFNRNQIKTLHGTKWLTIPVKSGASNLPINQVMIADDLWIIGHLNLISEAYRNAPYYKKYFPIFKKSFERKPRLLKRLNMWLYMICTQLLDIHVPIIMASELEIKTTSTQRLVDICKKLGATEYLAGSGSKAYLDVSLFKKAGIKVIFQGFKHPIYKQQYGGFVPNLSILDYLMNVGSEPFWENEK